jgi:RimJ/RimL family protein N-acetyltransferase
MSPNPASVRVLEKIGMRLVDSYHDEDGPRDIYRRQPPLWITSTSKPESYPQARQGSGRRKS